MEINESRSNLSRFYGHNRGLSCLLPKLDNPDRCGIIALS